MRTLAGGGARTHTALRPLDFESSASANSATPAFAVFETTKRGTELKFESRFQLRTLEGSQGYPQRLKHRTNTCPQRSWHFEEPILFFYAACISASIDIPCTQG